MKQTDERWKDERDKKWACFVHDYFQTLKDYDDQLAVAYKN